MILILKSKSCPSLGTGYFIVSVKIDTNSNNLTNTNNFVTFKCFLNFGILNLFILFTVLKTKKIINLDKMMESDERLSHWKPFTLSDQ